MFKAALTSIAFLLLLTGASSAQQTLQNGEATIENPWAEGGYQAIPLPEVDGAVPWETLHQVELVFDGPDLVPEFGEEVQKNCPGNGSAWWGSCYRWTLAESVFCSANSRRIARFA